MHLCERATLTFLLFSTFSMKLEELHSAHLSFVLLCSEVQTMTLAGLYFLSPS